MRQLRKHVEAEFEQLERVLKEFPQNRLYTDLSTLELAGVSTLLHNFYNGTENILKYVVQDRGLIVPTGPSWHRDLVNLAVSVGLIASSTADALRPYLAFRHFFVHAYAMDLQAERLGPLSENVQEVFDIFKRDIEKLTMKNDAYPELTDLNIRLQELESQGYTVFPEYLDRDTTAAIRAHIDSLVGPIVSADHRAARRDLRHPIPGEIMARLVNNPATLELAATLIGSRELRMREQVFIRSDPSPPPYQAPQWHIDAAFCRAEFEAKPRQVYYQMLHCCSTVSAGGAAFMIVPGSHKLSLAAIDKVERTEGRGPIQNHTALVPDANDDDGIEICANDGDLIVFNPLCYHASSPNRTSRPRYVYFTSFYHPSAARLIELVRRTKYRDDFPDSLRQALPPELQSLLD